MKYFEKALITTIAFKFICYLSELSELYNGPSGVSNFFLKSAALAAALEINPANKKFCYCRIRHNSAIIDANIALLINK